jgi:signal transduction histidine kinase
LDWEGAVPRLSIRDNGQGFDVMAVAGTGVGLQSMRDRVERVGGTLDITSTAAGTCIETRISLAQHVGKEG